MTEFKTEKKTITLAFNVGPGDYINLWPNGHIIDLRQPMILKLRGLTTGNHMNRESRIALTKAIVNGMDLEILGEKVQASSVLDGVIYEEEGYEPHIINLKEKELHFKIYNKVVGWDEAKQEFISRTETEY